MSFPFISADLETCGLDPSTSTILEFAAVLDDLSNPKPIDELPVFHTYFDQPTYTGQPYALSMHPVIFRRIAERTPPYTYMSPMRLGNAFKQFLIKHGYKMQHDTVTITVAGKNFGSFDLQFLKNQTDLLKHVHIRHRILDPSVLYLQSEDDKLPGMEECKKRIGDNSEVSHDAIGDAKDIIKLVRYKLKDIFEVPF